MKNQFARFLSTAVFALAIGTSLANSAVLPQGAILKKKVNGTWQFIPVGEHYQCSPSSVECTALFIGNQLVAGSITYGIYTVLP